MAAMVVEGMVEADMRAAVTAEEDTPEGTAAEDMPEEVMPVERTSAAGTA